MYKNASFPYYIVIYVEHEESFIWFSKFSLNELSIGFDDFTWGPTARMLHCIQNIRFCEKKCNRRTEDREKELRWREERKKKKRAAMNGSLSTIKMKISFRYIFVVFKIDLRRRDRYFALFLSSFFSLTHLARDSQPKRKSKKYIDKC